MQGGLENSNACNRHFQRSNNCECGRENKANTEAWKQKNQTFNVLMTLRMKVVVLLCTQSILFFP